MTRILAILLLLSSLSLSMAFTSPVPTTIRQARTSTILLSSSPDDPLADLDDDRKSNLFSTLLRDLQVEGVPLLGCDADQVHTLQAAIWTTMAELSAQDDAQRACLILEQIPTAALQTFVDDFLVLKTQSDQMEQLPELERVSVSLVGKGLGPALVLEVTEKKGEAVAATTVELDEFKCSAAMKAFMNRVVVGNDSPTSIGLGDEGSAAPIDYRFSASPNVCNTVASFWNCVCEMQSDASIGTLCLQLPSVGNDSNRFATVSQLLSRSLCLYQGDSVFSLVHFSPTYDRSKIEPVDKPAFGHLPPTSWLLPMLKANGDDVTAMEDAALGNSNYQRRSPITAVNIVRNSMLADPKIVIIELDDGMQTQASGLEVYCPNTMKLASSDGGWEDALAAEIAILD